MTNNKLILRTLNSGFPTPFQDITLGSVLSHADLDNNFIYLKGEVIYTAQTNGTTITLKKINGNEFSFNIDSSGTTLYIEVNYNELTTLISSSGLSEGSLYLITDYQTIYIQPDYYSYLSEKPVDSTMIKTGSTEPIVVLATSNNTISKDVWSTIHPNDKIEYLYQSDELYTGILTKGKIVRRIDKSNNDFPFDFRKVKFKRYESFYGPVLTVSVSSVGAGYQDGLAYIDDSWLSLITSGGQIVSATVIRNYGGTFEVGQSYTVIQDGLQYGQHGQVTVNTIGDDPNYFDFYRIIYDTGLPSIEYNVFGLTTELDNDSYQQWFYNNKVDSQPLENLPTFNIWEFNTVFYWNGSASDNYFSSYSKNNSFYYGGSKNRVTGTMRNSLIMNYFEGNIVNGEINNLLILEGDEVNESCINNIIELGGEILNLVVNKEFYGNKIYGQYRGYTLSAINSEFRGLVWPSNGTVNFNNSKLNNVYNGSNFNYTNSTVTSFINNINSNFYIYFPNNITNCTLNGWQDNYVIGELTNIKCEGNGLFNCTLGSYSNPNLGLSTTAMINTEIKNNTISSISSINFENATIVTGDYNKTIMRNSTGSLKLVYLDNTDAFVTATNLND